ncbi:hypothetical protein [Roseicyclus sp.]|uniref:hypothetical protein n=1 Tax=Roseicyclus sp. TaxID=1914329 RepID=UPI003F6D320F
MNPLLRIAAALAMVSALGGCVAEEVWAPDTFVSTANYQPTGPATLTLMTMVSNRDGRGGHSALMIDGAQRVLFDPAGSWYHPLIPERNDVLYGMSPQFLQFYTDYHARETYHIVVQEREVTPEVAAQIIAAVEANGAVPPARCSLSISSLLGDVPGFESITANWFPIRTMEQFGALTGVRESRIYDTDADDNLELLQAQARAELSRQIAQEAAARNQ